MDRAADRNNLTITIETQIPKQLNTEGLMNDIKALLCERAVKARLKAHNTEMVTIAKALLQDFKIHLHHYSALSKLPIDYDDIEKIDEAGFLYAANYIGEKICDSQEFYSDRIAKQTFEMFVEARIKGMFNDDITEFLQYLGERTWI